MQTTSYIENFKIYLKESLRASNLSSANLERADIKELIETAEKLLSLSMVKDMGSDSYYETIEELFAEDITRAIVNNKIKDELELFELEIKHLSKLKNK